MAVITSCHILYNANRLRQKTFAVFTNYLATAKVFQQKFHNASQKVLHEQHNRESFPAKFNKILQPRKFSTVNDLHYMVSSYVLEAFELDKNNTKTQVVDKSIV